MTELPAVCVIQRHAGEVAPRVQLVQVPLLNRLTLLLLHAAIELGAEPVTRAAIRAASLPDRGAATVSRLLAQLTDLILDSAATARRLRLLVATRGRRGSAVLRCKIFRSHLLPPWGRYARPSHYALNSPFLHIPLLTLLTRARGTLPGLRGRGALRKRAVRALHTRNTPPTLLVTFETLRTGVSSVTKFSWADPKIHMKHNKQHDTPLYIYL